MVKNKLIINFGKKLNVNAIIKNVNTIRINTSLLSLIVLSSFNMLYEITYAGQ